MDLTVVPSPGPATRTYPFSYISIVDVPNTPPSDSAPDLSCKLLSPTTFFLYPLLIPPTLFLLSLFVLSAPPLTCRPLLLGSTFDRSPQRIEHP